MTLCRRCGPFCNTGGCYGYFLPEVKAGVYCTLCPATDCADCEDFTGKCTECRPGLGLVDGECRGCRDENCKTCNGEQSLADDACKTGPAAYMASTLSAESLLCWACVLTPQQLPPVCT